MLRLISVLGAAAFLLPASVASADGVSTPGYRGTTKAPATKPIVPLPKPSDVGGGGNPGVLVDAGGTAHVAFNGPVVSGDGGKSKHDLSYCRVKRGTTSCDNPPASRTFQRGELASGRPYVVAFGETLLLLTQRVYDNFRGGPVVAYVSEDGGSSFMEAVVGGTSADDSDRGRAILAGAIVFGAPGSERIGLFFTGGFFQSIRPGTAPGSMVDLFPEDDQQIGFPKGSLATAPGKGLVAAVEVLGRKTALRSWNRTGDPGDPGQWSPRRTLPGTLPLLGGSQSATWLQTSSTGTESKLELRKIGDGGVAAAPRSLGPSAAMSAAPLVDAQGDVTVNYIGHLGKQRVGAGIGVPGVITRTLDGSKLSKPRLLFKGRLFDPVVAELPDGGGFVTADTGLVRQRVLVGAFGSQAATGAPSLGGQPGGGPNLDPKVLETCSKIKFSALSVDGEGGCLLQAVGSPGTKVAEGTLNLNGLEVIPDPNVKILLNSRKGTFDTTGKVTVQLRLDGSTVIPLMHDELHLELPSEKDTTEAAPGCKGVKLLSFDASKYLPVLQGFPIKGLVGVYLGADSACIPISLALPKTFADIRGNAVLKTTNKDGLIFDSMKIAVANIYVGPLLVEDLTIAYTRVGNQWDGSAKVGLPPQPGGVKLGGTIRFKDGAFAGATIVADPPFPGLALVGPTFLTSVGGGFHLDPFSLTATATVSAIPLAPGVYTLSIRGKLVITFGDPVVFDFTGDGTLLKFPFATARVRVTSDGFFGAGAELFFSLPGASATGKADVFIDLPSKTFSGKVDAEVCVLSVCPRAEAILSSIGIGACVDIKLLEGGFGYKWGDTLPEIFFPTCDLSDYEPPRPAAASPSARAAQIAPNSFAVAAGAAVASVKLIGKGGPPSVALVSPSGQRIVPSADLGATNAPAYAMSDAKTNATFVGVIKPAAGVWKVEPQEGSAPIVELRQALPVTSPSVQAKLGGKGRKRTLQFRVAVADGLSTTFIETDARGDSRVIGKAKTASGTLRFSTGYGAKGKRTVTARTDRDGIPRLVTTVGSYIAPAPERPSRPSRVRVTRFKGGLLVRWGKSRLAAGYAVTVSLSDGRRLLFPTRATKVHVRAVPRDLAATVTVAGRDRTGHSGPKATEKTRRQGGAR